MFLVIRSTPVYTDEATTAFARGEEPETRTDIRKADVVGIAVDFPAVETLIVEDQRPSESNRGQAGAQYHTVETADDLVPVTTVEPV